MMEGSGADPMKAIIQLTLLPLLAWGAQGPVVAHTGERSGLHSGGVPPGARRPVPPRSGYGIPFYGGWVPYPFPDYDYGYAPYTPAPSVVVIEPPPAYVQSAVATEPPRSEIHEYKNLPAGPSAPAEGEPQAFAIALRNSTVLFAIAVTAQGDTLHYVDPDGRHGAIPLGSIDRGVTRRLNRERGLDLQLPPPSH
jgi:hypothetical protein